MEKRHIKIFLKAGQGVVEISSSGVWREGVPVWVPFAGIWTIHPGQVFDVGKVPVVNRGTIAEMELLFIQLKQLHKLGWLVIRKLLLLRHFVPKAERLITKVLEDFDVFGHPHLVHCLPKLLFIKPIPAPLVLESLDCTSWVSVSVMGIAVVFFQNQPPGVGMDQWAVVSANTAVKFIEQINLSTKLGRRFDTFALRLLLLFSLFGVFWLFLLLLLLLFQLFFFLVATIRLISRLKRVFKPTGNTVHHLNKPMLVPVYHARVHPEKQVGEYLHSCRWELFVR